MQPTYSIRWFVSRNDFTAHRGDLGGNTWTYDSPDKALTAWLRITADRHVTDAEFLRGGRDSEDVIVSHQKAG